MNRHALLLLLIATAWFTGDSLAMACPNCGDAMASDPAQAGLVRGIFWSILFLLSMPFLIFAGIAGYFYWLIRSARANAPVLAEVNESHGTYGTDETNRTYERELERVS